MFPADFNIRLLQIFDEVHRTRSVSKAAERLATSQPSVSIGLGKLRDHFGDSLFVKTTRGMEPTPYAQQLIPTIRSALQLLEQALGSKASFDPGSSDRLFRICMTDITQMVVLPHLLGRCRKIAPGVSIEVLRVTDQTVRALESGEVDLVVGYIPDLGSGFYQQRLLMRDFVCIASSRHPRLRKTLSLQEFDSESHVVVTAGGSGLRHAEEMLQARKVKRRVLLRVPDLLSIGPIIANSELLATVNRPVGHFLATQGDVKVFEHPFNLPRYPVNQHWHERYHLDLPNQWLRHMMAEIMSPNAKLI